MARSRTSPLWAATAPLGEDRGLDHGNGEQFGPQLKREERHTYGEDPEVARVPGGGERPERLVVLVVDRVHRVAVVLGVAEEFLRVLPLDITPQREVIDLMGRGEPSGLGR